MLCFYVRSKLISTVCYYHVKYAFQSESTLYSCLNVKKLFALNRRNISSLSDSNTIRTHSHLVRPLATTTGQMTELCCEYLSVWCIWLCYSHVSCVSQSQNFAISKFTFNTLFQMYFYIHMIIIIIIIIIIRIIIIIVIIITTKNLFPFAQRFGNCILLMPSLTHTHIT